MARQICSGRQAPVSDGMVRCPERPAAKSVAAMVEVCTWVGPQGKLVDHLETKHGRRFERG
jgi:hypothetical protein